MRWVLVAGSSRRQTSAHFRDELLTMGHCPNLRIPTRQHPYKNKSTKAAYQLFILRA
jgi:hypothetical protein